MPGPTYPSPYREPERYVGRPLLILLETYILDTIGELPAGKNVASLVQRVWGGDADWRHTMRRQLDLPETVDAEIRKLWHDHQATARRHGQDVHAVQFAKWFVDDRWAHLLDA